MQNLKINTILAVSKNYGIGHLGRLPWKLKKDMDFFKRTTTTYGLPPISEKKNVVIMGRNTWESLPDKNRPLKDRINIVITSDPSKIRNSLDTRENSTQNLLISNNLENSIDYVRKELGDKYGQVFVIGGAKLFEESFHHPDSNELFLTRIGKDFDCDRFVSNDFLKKYKAVEISKTFSENNIPFDFARYQNKLQKESNLITNIFPENNEEMQYLRLIEEVITNGVDKDDRTNIGTYALFGKMMRFDLEHSFPLLTTKEVFWKGVVEELLWFIKGETDSKKLSEKKVKIWDANGSREFLDKLGFQNREVGDLGPVYGFQWKHFGAKYVDNKTDYSGQGVDQLKYIIEEIKKNPNSRRLIMSAWNPSDLKLMALPPCHVMAHFQVMGQKLNCLLYQRSCDVGLGVPFNIASYALLTCMIADICGLKRGEFVHTMGDVHVYKNHVDALKTQIKRVPNPFPVLQIKERKTNLEDYKFEDFYLIGYNPYGKIKMPMAV